MVAFSGCAGLTGPEDDGDGTDGDGPAQEPADENGDGDDAGDADTDTDADGNGDENDTDATGSDDSGSDDESTSDQDQEQSDADGTDEGEENETDPGDGNETVPGDGDGNESNENETNESDTSTLTVSVVTDDTGEPIESDVRLRGPADDPSDVNNADEQVKSTGVDGTVTFEGLEDGHYEVYADPVDYDVSYAGIYVGEIVEINGSDVSTIHELPPEPEWYALTISVTDKRTGEPIEDAAVSVRYMYPYTGAEVGFDETTDANGTVTGEVPDQTVNYRVDAEGYHSESDYVEVDSNETIDVALESEDSHETTETYTVTFHVVGDDAGAAPSDVTVTDTQSGEAAAEVHTGDDGVVDLELEAGEYHIKAEPGYEISDDLYDGETITVSSDTTIMHEIPTPREKTYIEISVTDADTGEDIEGASVALSGGDTISGEPDTASGETNEYGDFGAEIVPGTYEVTVEAEGYLDESTQIDTSEGSVFSVSLDNDPETNPRHPYHWVEYSDPGEEEVWNTVEHVRDEPAPQVTDEATFSANLGRHDVQDPSVERDGDTLHVAYTQPATDGPTESDWETVTQDMGAVTEAYWGWYRHAPDDVPARVQVEVYGEDGDLLITYTIDYDQIETFDGEYHQDPDGMSYPAEELAYSLIGEVETHVDTDDW